MDLFIGLPVCVVIFPAGVGTGCFSKHIQEFIFEVLLHNMFTPKDAGLIFVPY